MKTIKQDQVLICAFMLKTRDHSEPHGMYNGYVGIHKSIQLPDTDPWSSDEVLHLTGIHCEITLDRFGWIQKEDMKSIFPVKDVPEDLSEWRIIGFDTCHYGDTAEKWNYDTVREETMRLYNSVIKEIKERYFIPIQIHIEDNTQDFLIKIEDCSNIMTMTAIDDKLHKVLDKMPMEIITNEDGSHTIVHTWPHFQANSFSEFVLKYREEMENHGNVTYYFEEDYLDISEITSLNQIPEDGKWENGIIIPNRIMDDNLLK